MARANGAMDRIMQSSARISNIIGLTGNIAFPANLLALKASVEAARADMPARDLPSSPSSPLRASAAIDDLLIAVTALDEMTRHNAALAEQTNAAQAQTPDMIIDLFTIAEVAHVP